MTEILNVSISNDSFRLTTDDVLSALTAFFGLTEFHVEEITVKPEQTQDETEKIC